MSNVGPYNFNILVNGKYYSNSFNFTTAYLWSKVETWPSGRVPVDGEDIVLLKGKTYLLDESTAALNSLTIIGTLMTMDNNLSIISSSLDI